MKKRKKVVKMKTLRVNAVVCRATGEFRFASFVRPHCDYDERRAVLVVRELTPKKARRK